MKEEFNEILKIEHTSSKKCKEHESSAAKDPQGYFRPMKVSAKNRDCRKRFQKMVYSVMRTYYVSFYFYFTPFLALIVATFVPLFVDYQGHCGPIS